MFFNEPTLYGTTFPQREFPYYTPWAQQFPWMNYNRFYPNVYGQEFFPQNQFPYYQTLYNKFLPQYGIEKFLPQYGVEKFMPQYGFTPQQWQWPVYNYTLPQQMKWQVPFIH